MRLKTALKLRELSMGLNGDFASDAGFIPDEQLPKFLALHAIATVLAAVNAWLLVRVPAVVVARQP